ncbi:MAG: TonB-dependent receptor [Gemmatimonadales bacterium]
MRPCILALAAICLAAPLRAQQPHGLLLVRVHADSAPVAEAVVRTGRFGALTGPDGTARLTLPAGPRLVSIARVGFHPESTTVRVAADSTTTLDVQLTAAEVELEEIVVSTTRGLRRLDDEPVRVEVLSGEDVAEKTQMRPADLTRILTEMVGIRMQSGASALGATRLRIQGLRGQYTGLLSDGLPLYGGTPGGFGLLQLAPIDLAQAEVIKGSSTVFVGPAALGGVLNLISRRPTARTHELVLNQSLQEGSDALFWGAEPFSPTTGLTLFADAHGQSRRDLDGDGWADITGFRRASVRPRLYWTAPNGDALLATVGALTESREGGYISALNYPGGGNPYRERLGTTRVDGGLTYRRSLSGSSHLQLRTSGMYQRTDHRFGTATEADRRYTVFGELSYTATTGPVEWVAGAAWQGDGFRPEDTPAFRYTYSVPAGFGQVTWSPMVALAAALSARCDRHNEFGTRCSPRASLLVKPTGSTALRASAGTGFFAPVPLTEETDATGLRLVVPTRLQRETARTAALDASWKRGPLEVSGTLALSELQHPVALVPRPGDPQGRVQFINVDGPTRITSGELFGVYEAKPIVVTVFYGYLKGTERDPAGAGRRELGLTPRHSAGVDVTWEAPETGTWIAVEAFYTGRQAVYDDPARTRSRPYAVTEILLSQRVGVVTFFLNLDNLSDERVTRHEPLVLAQPAPGGRRTIVPWGPVEGRVLSAGARAQF